MTSSYSVRNQKSSGEEKLLPCCLACRADLHDFCFRIYDWSDDCMCGHDSASAAPAEDGTGVNERRGGDALPPNVTVPASPLNLVPAAGPPAVPSVDRTASSGDGSNRRGRDEQTT